MGSYYDLRVAGYQIASGKNYLAGEWATLFQDSDRRVYEETILAQERRERGFLDGDEDIIRTVVKFCASTRHVIDRMEVMGYGLRAAKQEFRHEVKQYRTRWNQEDAPWMNVPRTFTFERWAEAAHEAIANHHVLETWGKDSDAHQNRYPALEHNHQVFSDYFLFGENDYRFGFRALLELVDKDADVVLDCSEIVYGGWMAEDESLSQYLPKTLILTEGATDTEILKKTLEVLYPHLKDYFHFMDFSDANIAGGVAQLVHIIKAFVGSNIRSCMIALFDNDTAAYDAMRSLAAIRLPDNIQVLQLPPLKYARKYPTIGPQGVIKMNVNGLACSLEMFYGLDVLRDDQGQLTPIQWTGYIPGVRRYQGEVLNKSHLRAKYLSLLQNAAQQSAPLLQGDWSAMETLFKAIFSASADCSQRVRQTSSRDQEF